MPAPSIISQLPDVLRAALDEKLRRQGYAGLQAIAAWLTEQGYPISRAAVGVYSQRLKYTDHPGLNVSPQFVRAAVHLALALQQFLAVSGDDP